MSLRFYDTNALLLLQEEAFQEAFFIASETLIELESIKSSAHKDQETKWRARNAARLIQENRFLVQVVICQENIRQIIEDFSLAPTPDVMIIASAKYMYDVTEDVVFYTNDILCKTIADKIFRIPTQFVKAVDDSYCGYKLLTPSADELHQFYSDPTINHFGLLPNEYAILQAEDGTVIDKCKWVGDANVRILPRTIKSTMFGDLRPYRNDVYQSLAIDSMWSNQVTMLSGKAASGKTYLALSFLYYLLEHHEIDKILVFANTVPVRNTATIGFLPGTREEKLLESSVGNILSSKLGGRYGVQDEISRGHLEIYPACDIRGFDTTNMRAGVLITEAENTDKDLLKLMLQRLGEDSKCIVEGDYESQVDSSAYAGAVNGMRCMSQAFRGESLYGEVKLQNIYRSKIAAIADKM